MSSTRPLTGHRLVRYARAVLKRADTLAKIESTPTTIHLLDGLKRLVAGLGGDIVKYSSRTVDRSASATLPDDQEKEDIHIRETADRILGVINLVHMLQREVDRDDRDDIVRETATIGSD